MFGLGFFVNCVGSVLILLCDWVQVQESSCQNEIDSDLVS